MRLAGLIAILVAAVLAVFLLPFPFMWLWNYSVCGAVTFAKPIGYGVALGLMVFISMFIVGVRSSK